MFSVQGRKEKQLHFQAGVLLAKDCFIRTEIICLQVRHKEMELVKICVMTAI